LSSIDPGPHARRPSASACRVHFIELPAKLGEFTPFIRYRRCVGRTRPPQVRPGCMRFSRAILLEIENIMEFVLASLRFRLAPAEEPALGGISGRLATGLDEQRSSGSRE
jgi:hypothetical protein